VPTHQQVLITGAGGHVGGRLSAHLTTSGTKTRALLRSQQSLPEWAARAEVVHGDLNDASVRREVLRGVHTVAHLATRGSSSAAPPTSQELRREEEIALSLLDDAITVGVSRFVYLSSIHVYGDSLAGHVDDATPTRPNSDYGRSRQRIEERMLQRSAATNTQTVVVRLSNAFGVPTSPRPETWNLLMHDLCRQVVTSRSLVLRSDPRICHDSMALCDVIEVLAQIVMSSQSLQGVYLLASGETMQLAELAALIQRHAKEVLAVSAEVKVSHHQSIVPTTFTLDTRRLRDAGILIPNNRNQEICDLLRYAQREFGQGRS
jgi:UDP-glucose 4-epimerase